MPLVDDLRYITKYVTAMTFQVKKTCGDAANEIERLQRERDGWQKNAIHKAVRIAQTCPHSTYHGGCHYPDCPPDCPGRKQEAGVDP